MNHNDQTPPHDPFEARLIDGLDRLASSTPTHEPDHFDPNAVPLVTNEPEPRRTGAYLTAAAAVAALTVTGLVAISARNEEQPAQADQTAPPASPSSTVEQTASTTPLAVRGVPVCGAELPVTIDIPAAVGGANPGPAVYGPTSEGQLAQYWDLPAGTIEVRWPADEREIYDLDANRGDPTAFDRLGVATPDDGSQAIVQAPNIDPGLDDAVESSSEPAADQLDAISPTLTMTATDAAPALGPPCDVMQVRYIDLNGNQMTLGYNPIDFSVEPAFGIDLNPLITSSGDPASAPDAANTASCGNNDLDDNTAGPIADTPADALAAFLESEQAPASFSKSGYAEFEISDDTVDYAIIKNGTLITLISVDHTDTGWAATHVASAGC
ncbi:hypothetical protein [Ilumatobacter sp.]|uniref:hypothetical protein n=1 Tax=Ilumatobacter sp. TaxID=1967498 RepID=UPI003C450049